MDRKIVALIIVTCLAFSVSFVYASQVKTVQVGALQEQMIAFNLGNGDKFSGSLSITGGGGNDIDFSVTDPQGTTIVGLGRVSQGRSFEFTAQQSGAYTLHFDNDFSIFSSKTITLSYDITRPILGGLGGGVADNSLMLIIGAIAIIAVVVVLVVVLTKRKSTPNNYQQPYPPPPT